MTVAVSMSAVWLKFITFLCLFFTALSAPENGGLQWRNVGESITIQCKCPESDQESLDLKKGLNEDVQILYHNVESKKNTIANQFLGRLQVYAQFPKVEILIKNLTSNDTGPYWCLCKTFDMTSAQIQTIKGEGSVLLVVEGDGCKESKDNLVMVSVVISAAVLLSIIMGIFIWLIKTKTVNPTRKPRRIPNNDVYEDMRGTLRR